ncbi:LysR family transcriptional regulator [Rhodoferax sp. TS-BS-61-7]|uniref:LysR family transcriptional regulator n=1 Tax=Rhodoferax sp. TS-BS-61-7 TaxID=2094194 RepID=UPI000CF67F2F|nr:LysR family transcriptional regulator [Rhodoferax sp. TS-BS-61-7]PQA79441.1 LysR family transcriptional regulator [Rhodoferax sp. TS-BS-61-7]
MKTTLEELLAFRAVVDTGSITAAADQLEQTVSGISRALSRLEKKLGTTLLRRTTRRLELTEEGQAFLARTRAILDAMDAAEEEMATRREAPTGLLRVNAASPFMLHAIVPLVPEFHRLFPGIHLELNTDDLNVDLLAQRTDIAIRIGTLRDSTLHARPLCSSRLRVLASPAYLAQHGKPKRVADLTHHALIGNSQLSALNDWPLRSPQGDHYRATLAFSASSGETMRQLALAGLGLVCLADFMTEADRTRGDLVQVLARDTVEVRQPVNAVYYRNTALSSRITAFLDFLAARLQ